VGLAAGFGAGGLWRRSRVAGEAVAGPGTLPRAACLGEGTAGKKFPLYKDVAAGVPHTAEK
jgi:hypothetical protein